MDRNALLTRWARFISGAARSGALTGKPCPITRIETIAGPRAGALEIFAGLESGRLLRALGKNDAAALRQFIPWHFRGDPQVFMAGRYVRIEGGWPDSLSESMIRLHDLANHPHGGNRWLAGKSESGATIMPGLTDKTPHWLVSGATGSGKSVALRSAVLQLSQDPDNRIVLVDGKRGEGLHDVARLPGVVGPVATDGPQVRGALGWACAEMLRRYQAARWDGRLVLVVDEFQELVSDQVVVDLLRKLCAQGRAAHVHCLLATQHPTVAAFGDSSIRRNLSGKLALMVADPDASRVAVGGATPRADRLLGAGDCYTVAPGACHRVQGAYVDAQDFDKAGYGVYQFPRWPDYEAESVGQDIPAAWSYNGAELGVSIVSASESEGRPKMTRRLLATGQKRPGAERAIRLLRLGREALDSMNGQGYTVCLSGTAHTDGPGQCFEAESA